MNWIKRIKSIPERKFIIVMGKVSLIKNLLYFCFKLLVGIVFRSWFLITIAVYSAFIGIVKDNCSRGLKKNKDTLRDIESYVRGGTILACSSVFYITYSVFQMFYPSNTKYHMIVAIAIAAFATCAITISIIGVVRAKGKTMLIKEYKLTNFAAAFNNIMLAQIAILSFTSTSNKVALYNGITGVCVGVIVLVIGLYLLIDGLIKKKTYDKLIKKYPDFFEQTAIEN